MEKVKTCPDCKGAGLHWMPHGECGGKGCRRCGNGQDYRTCTSCKGHGSMLGTR